jgi:hypothetical protein
MSHPLVHTPASLRQLSIAHVVARAQRTEPALLWTALAHAALVPVLLALMPLDGRIILGIDPWIKPLKFAMSIAIYTATVALLLLPLQESRARAFVRWGTLLPLSIEMALIAMQSARGTTSHFNESTVFDATVFAVMGISILVATAAGIVLFVLHARSRALAPALAWGVRAGIAISLAGAAIGGAMVSHEGHAVGAAEGGEGLPVVHWSREGGDLRIAHFAGLHASQTLPLVGLAVQRRERGVRIVAAASIVYALAVAALFALALAGRPLFG